MKNRKFVRAYAPVLAGTLALAKNFPLRFLETLVKANEVRSLICSHRPHLQQLTTPLGLEVD
jgi:hypothetical protein